MKIKSNYNKKDNIVRIECDLNQAAYLLSWLEYMDSIIEEEYPHHLPKYKEWINGLKPIQIQIDKDSK